MTDTPTTHSCLTTCYSPGNPYWERIAERLREQGGLHAPSTGADDRRYLAEQLSIDAKVMHGKLPAYTTNQF